MWEGQGGHYLRKFSIQLNSSYDVCVCVCVCVCWANGHDLAEYPNKTAGAGSPFALCACVFVCVFLNQHN